MDAETAAKRYVELRSRWEHDLRNLSAYLGESWSELTQPGIRREPKP